MTDNKALFEKAADLYDAGKFEDAIRCYDMALRI